MQRHALVENGQIVAFEFFKRPELVPEGWLPVEVIVSEYDASTQYLGELTYDVQADAVFETREVLDKSPEMLEANIVKSRKSKLAALASRRWQATQYFQFDGVKAPADSAIQAITAIAVSVSMGLRSETDLIVWKLIDGEFRHWSLQQLLSYASAIQVHIQNCFNHEALLSGLIQAADTIEDIDSVDIETGWPN